MIVLIVCLFGAVLAWNVAGACFKLLVAYIDLAIQLIKLGWRLLTMCYCWLRRRRGAEPPALPAKPLPGDPGGHTMGSADVRPLKNDRPINSRLSNHYKK